MHPKIANKRAKVGRKLKIYGSCEYSTVKLHPYATVPLITNTFNKKNSIIHLYENLKNFVNRIHSFGYLSKFVFKKTGKGGAV